MHVCICIFYNSPGPLPPGDKFNRTISLKFTGRSGDTSTVMWKKDGEPLLSTSNDDLTIMTEYSGNMVATTSLTFTSDFPSRSFRGVYSVVISNDNDIIPENQRSTNFTFQISVTSKCVWPQCKVSCIATVL